MSRPLVTYSDLIAHILDYLGSNATQEAARDARRAALDAYRELSHAHRWMYYQSRGRVQTVAHYNTGTIAYDHTGGLYERMLTLTDGVWPTWAARGTVLVDQVVYLVAERKSDTVVTLNIDSNPGLDVVAGTEYTIYQDTYPLPHDFLEMEQIYEARRTFWLEFGEPGEWMGLQTARLGPASPRMYTIMGHPDFYGCLGLFLWPPPDNIYYLDFVYHRRPRPLKLDQVDAGLVTTTSGSATVTGDGTAWTSSMAGSVLRFSATKQDLPTGPSGGNPAASERIITSVASATSLSVDSVLGDSFSGVKYLISDPVDIEEGAMFTALLRCCEQQTTIVRIMKNLAMAQGNYRDALILAREADARSYARRSPGPRRAGYRRLANMPRGSDVS